VSRIDPRSPTRLAILAGQFDSGDHLPYRLSPLRKHMHGVSYPEHRCEHKRDGRPVNGDALHRNAQDQDRNPPNGIH